MVDSTGASGERCPRRRTEVWFQPLCVIVCLVSYPVSELALFSTVADHPTALAKAYRGPQADSTCLHRRMANIDIARLARWNCLISPCFPRYLDNGQCVGGLAHWMLSEFCCLMISSFLISSNSKSQSIRFTTDGTECGVEAKSRTVQTDC